MAVPVESFRFRAISRFSMINSLFEVAERGMVDNTGDETQDIQTRTIFSALRHLNSFLEMVDIGAKVDEKFCCIAMMNCVAFTYPPVVEDMKESLTGIEKKSKTNRRLSRMRNRGTSMMDIKVQRVVPRSPFIIDPKSRFRTLWDILCLLIVLVDSIIVPFQIAFATEIVDSGPDVWYIFGTCVFCVDICTNFVTGFVAGEWERDHGQLVTDRWRIFKYYMRTWFLIDIVSTIPWQLLNIGGSVDASSVETAGTKLTKLTKLTKIIRFLRLARMLRLFKLQGLWERLEQSIGPLHVVEVLKLAKVFALLIYICHWNACVWWMIGNVDSIFSPNDDRYPETWTTLKSSISFSDSYGDTFTNFNNWLEVENWDRYIFCFYWTTGIMRTMPVEVYPTSRLERLYTLVFMFFGLSVFSICISRIVTSWYRIGKLRADFEDSYASVRSYLHENDVDSVLIARIRGYLQHRFASRSIYAGETQLLNMLSAPLYSELNYALYGNQINIIWFFADITAKEILHTIAGLLHQTDTAPGDRIMRKNEMSTHCGILVHGMLSYSEPVTHNILKVFQSETVRRELSRNGPICTFNVDILLFKTPSVCLTSVWSEQCSTVLLIAFDEFLSLRSEHPDINQHMWLAAKSPRGVQARKSLKMIMSQLDKSKK